MVWCGNQVPIGVHTTLAVASRSRMPSRQWRTPNRLDIPKYLFEHGGHGPTGEVGVPFARALTSRVQVEGRRLWECPKQRAQHRGCGYHMTPRHPSVKDILDVHIARLNISA